MQLYGMLDSSFVRRVAISLDMLNIPFEHIPLSVFKNYSEFRQVNPVVKAPSFITDEGIVFSDSSLILHYIETRYQCHDKLWPQDSPDSFPLDMRAVSLGLVACEKCAQFIYEKNLRPEAYRYEPWLDRVKEQLIHALTGLEVELQNRPAAFAIALRQATITAAITWQFVNAFMPDVADPAQHPHLAALSTKMEATAVYLKYPPVGPGVPNN